MDVRKLEVNGFKAFLNEEGDVIIYIDDLSKDFKTYHLKQQKQGCLGLSSKGLIVHSMRGNNSVIHDRRNLICFLEIDVKGGKQRHHEFREEVYAYSSSDLQSIHIRKNDSLTIINPVANTSYINVSLSPDRRHILFRASGRGVYVTNLEGHILFTSTKGQFPTWVNNNRILMAEVKDNGHHYLSSQLFLVDLGTEQRKDIVLKENLIPLFPSSTDNGRKIVFNTPENHIYLVDIQE